MKSPNEASTKIVYRWFLVVDARSRRRKRKHKMTHIRKSRPLVNIMDIWILIEIFHRHFIVGTSTASHIIQTRSLKPHTHTHIPEFNQSHQEIHRRHELLRSHSFRKRKSSRSVTRACSVYNTKCSTQKLFEMIVSLTYLHMSRIVSKQRSHHSIKINVRCLFFYNFLHSFSIVRMENVRMMENARVFSRLCSIFFSLSYRKKNM